MKKFSFNTICQIALLMCYGIQSYGQLKIMPLGNSITAGSSSGVQYEEYWISYRKALWDKLKNNGYDVDFVGSKDYGSGISDFDPDNEGHPGWTSSEILNGNLSKRLSTEKPNIILLHIGTNDLRENSANTSVNYIDDIVDTIHLFDPSIWIIVAQIINHLCCNNNPQCPECQNTSIFNSNLKNLWQDHFNKGERIVLVDMEKGAGINYTSHLEGGDMYAEDGFGGIHPSLTGYEKMAQVWYTAIKGILLDTNWHFVTGNRDWIRSSPAVGKNGNIYFGTRNGRIYSLNSDGTLDWSFRTGDMVNGSPAIDFEGNIYIGSLDGKLYSINSQGVKNWTYSTKFNSSLFSTPAISSEIIFIGSESPDNKILAITKEGVRKWGFTTKNRNNSSPAIGKDGIIYIGSDDKKLYAIYKGDKIWEFSTEGPIRSSPAIGKNNVIYVGSVDKKLYAIDANGKLKWEFKTEGPIDSSPAIGKDGRIYVGSGDGNLYALNNNGELRWKVNTGGSIISSPAIGSNGNIYIGSTNKWLFEINQEGTQTRGFFNSSGFLSSPAIDSKGILYIGTMDGILCAIDIGPCTLANTAWPMFHHDLRHTGKW